MLLAVPALRALRAARPGAPLVLAAQPRLGGLLAALGLVDRAVPFDALGLEALFVPGELPAGAALLRGAGRIVCWFGARDPAFTARLLALAPGAVVAPSTVPGRVVWEHLLETVGAAPAESAACRTPVAVPERLVNAGREALDAIGLNGQSRVALVHPGAGGVAKRWSADGFAAIGARLAARDLTVVVHRGPADRDAVAAVAARLGSLLVLEAPPLPALAGVLARVALYVGNDSGVTHLAAAVGAPCVPLYRASLVAWEPWRNAVRPVIVSTDALVETDLDAVMARIDALLG